MWPGREDEASVVSRCLPSSQTQQVLGGYWVWLQLKLFSSHTDKTWCFSLVLLKLKPRLNAGRYTEPQLPENKKKEASLCPKRCSQELISTLFFHLWECLFTYFMITVSLSLSVKHHKMCLKGNSTLLWLEIIIFRSLATVSVSYDKVVAEGYSLKSKQKKPQIEIFRFLAFSMGPK